MYLRLVVTAYITYALCHIGKTLNCFGKVLNGFFGVAVFNAVAHAVLDMALEDNLTYFMKCRFYRIDLRQDILAGHVLFHHTVDRLHLTDDLFQATVKIICIHTLFHFASSLFQIRHRIGSVTKVQWSSSSASSAIRFRIFCIRLSSSALCLAQS